MTTKRVVIKELSQLGLIALYLVAIVAANLSITWWGPGISIVNAFLFIGLDLTTRDRLHEMWEGNSLVWHMFALIAMGSLLSFIINDSTGPIALASAIAFGAAAITDTLVYNLLKNVKWLWRSNGSNVFSSAVDSILFPTIAFSAFVPMLVVGQFIAKIAGGFLWSIVLEYFRIKGHVSNIRNEESYL